MGIFDTLMGYDAARAAREAAADTYAKQQAAVEGLNAYGDDYASQFKTMGADYDPYIAAGSRLSGTSNDALINLITDPSSVRSLPGYQFLLDSSLDALDRRAASRGMLGSGNTSLDTLSTVTGLADQTYGSQLDRLMGINAQGFNQGMSATGAKQATTAQGLQGQLGTRTTAFGGQMQSAPTIGQGMVASANAESSALSNLMKTAAYLGGAFLGGPAMLGGAAGAAGAATGAPMNLGNIGGIGGFLGGWR